MHRRAVFVDVAARTQECMVDRADRYPARMIGLNREDLARYEEGLRRAGLPE
jgi:hypothetical protein